MTKTSLLGSAGRFGVRYGQSVKRRIAAIELIQRKKQKCLFCNGRAKRVSKGIWKCKKCGKTFAGHAYFLEQPFLNKENKEANTKPLKKETSSEKEKKTKTRVKK